jgi:uncharacterized protein (TIGR03086 family)
MRSPTRTVGRAASLPVTTTASRPRWRLSGSPGVLEKTIELEFGEFSGADLMGMAARDHFTHGWDLARAIGHHTELDPELADELLIQARAEILDAYRGPEGEAIFGPVAEAPAGACPADRPTAFLGRSVRPGSRCDPWRIRPGTRRSRQ